MVDYSMVAILLQYVNFVGLGSLGPALSSKSDPHRVYTLRSHRALLLDIEGDRETCVVML